MLTCYAARILQADRGQGLLYLRYMALERRREQPHNQSLEDEFFKFVNVCNFMPIGNSPFWVELVEPSMSVPQELHMRSEVLQESEHTFI